MSFYELHIVREWSPISEPEWREAVQEVDGLILGGPPLTAVDPNSGNKVTVPVGPSDVQLHFDGGWIPVFRFRNGRATFLAIAGLVRPDHPVRVAAIALAEQLSAQVVDGDDVPYEWPDPSDVVEDEEDDEYEYEYEDDEEETE